MSNHLFDAICSELRPESIFIETLSGETHTYEDMLKTSARLAGALIRLGVKPGDRIAAQVEKSPGEH